MAFRAPVLAALFLIVTFATLAMPGSANFVGELLVLFGAFEDKLVYGLVASVGVVLAAVYMIRVFQRTMHNRAGPAVESREIDGLDLAAVAPLVAVIVALGVYPQFVVDRTERATATRRGGRRGARAAPPRGGGDPMTLPLAEVQAPVIDYKELSPLMATVGGSIVVLMVGLLRGRFVQRVAGAGADGGSRCSRRSA